MGRKVGDLTDKWACCNVCACVCVCVHCTHMKLQSPIFTQSCQQIDLLDYFHSLTPSTHYVMHAHTCTSSHHPPPTLTPVHTPPQPPSPTHLLLHTSTHPPLHTLPYTPTPMHPAPTPAPAATCWRCSNG